MHSEHFIVAAIMTIAALMTVRTGKLTAAAAATGWITGNIIFAGLGYTGVCMLAAFFVLGTAATSWKMNVKQQLHLAEENKGKRTAGQVIANCGVAAILSLLVFVLPQYADVIRLMAYAGFASATADTLSSELGNVYGRKFYNVMTFKKDVRGRDGVVSAEGTVAGIAGSAIIAAMYAFDKGINEYILWIVMAGTIGNLSDSVLGATLERKEWLNNNAVNFLNTLIGSASILLFVLLSD